MAQIVKKKVVWPARNDKYPWKEWTDGRTRRAKKGIDFDIPVCRFQQKLHVVASKRGMRVHTKSDGTGAILFQFYTEDDE